MFITNDTAEILNYILQNAEMGEDTINHLLEISDNEAFKKSIALQRDEYAAIYNKASAALEKRGVTPEQQSAFTKMTTYLGITMKSAMDKSTRHLAEMMLQGSNMGIIDITKNLKDFPKAEQDAIKLGEHLLEFEKRNIEELKLFL